MKERLPLTHLRSKGGVRMVDVSDKADTVRTAVARGRVLLGEEAFRQLADHKIAKGDVLGIAQVAGILGAKQTSVLIPLCHSVTVTGIEVTFRLEKTAHAVEIEARARSVGPTGVEMEALTAISIAALTIYDMCKSVSKAIRITDIELLAKSGGKTGDYHLNT